MSPTNALKVLLGIGWRPVDRKQINGPVYRSGTGTVVSVGTPQDILGWAHRMTPFTHGNVLFKYRSLHGTTPDELEEVERPMVIAPGGGYGLAGFGHRHRHGD